MRGNLRTNIIVAMALLLAVTAARTVFKKSSVSLPSQKIKSTNTSSATVAPDNPDMPGWKRYANEKFGYSLQYPTDWYIDAPSEKQNEVSCAEDAIADCYGSLIDISNYPNPSQYYSSRSASRAIKPIEYPDDFSDLSGHMVMTELSLSDYIDKETEERGLKSWAIKKENVSLNGAQGIKRTATKDSQIITSYFFPDSRYIFYLSYNGQSEKIEQIISTLKISK